MDPIQFDIEELYIKQDKAINLIAVIAIYDLVKGAALGGCRMNEYATIDDAIHDAIRLSKAMHNKTTIFKLPYSGGKIVIVRPHELPDQIKFFHRVGDILNELKGKFITGCDIGVTKKDMQIVFERSPYVTAVDNDKVDHLSHCTAYGLYYACLAAIKLAFNKDSLQGIHIAIQGMGKIGSSFAEIMHQNGALLTICDFNKSLCDHFSKRFNAVVVNPQEIYSVHCDIFSPCGMGRILNEKNINQLSAKIICGGANDQLFHEEDGNRIFYKNIIYVPDFVSNGGGAIYASGFYQKIPLTVIKKTIQNEIYHLSQIILSRSFQEKTPTHIIANTLVNEYRNKR